MMEFVVTNIAGKTIQTNKKGGQKWKLLFIYASQRARSLTGKAATMSKTAEKLLILLVCVIAFPFLVLAEWVKTQK